MPGNRGAEGQEKGKGVTARWVWRKPNPKARSEGLAERDYGMAQLAEVAALINAEKSDIYDVLAYVAYAKSPITREERVAGRKRLILGNYAVRQQDFVDFILRQYVDQGVGELDQDKLPNLLELKYYSVSDAVEELGEVTGIRDLFVGFQKHLYEARAEA